MKKNVFFLSFVSISIFCLFLVKTCTFQSSKTTLTSPAYLPEEKERPALPGTSETKLSPGPGEVSDRKNKNTEIFNDSLPEKITAPPLKYYSGKN